MTDEPGQQDVTELLAAINSGDDSAAERLFPLVYDELRHLARGYLNRERQDHTLQATALVHEAYLKLVDQRDARIHDRTHFFAIAATAMRRVLVTYANKRRAAKRGGDNLRLTLDDALAKVEEQSVDLLALDEALSKLAEIDEPQSRLVELRFFGGMTMRQAARMLGMSEATAYREWAMARAWLHGQVSGG